MKNDCTFCVHYNKKVEDEPCFSCQSTYSKRNFEPMSLSKNEKHQNLQHKISEYKILYRKREDLWLKRCTQGLTETETKEFFNTKPEVEKLKNDISALIFDIAIWSKNIHIIEGVEHGKPRIII